MNSKEQLAANGNKKDTSGFELEAVKASNKPLVIAILGTGEFGRALGRKIFESCPKSAARIIFGSRNPTREAIRFVDQEPPAETFTHEDAIQRAGETSGHSNKGSMLVNYDSRVVIWAIF